MILYAWTNSDYNATIYSDTPTPASTGRYYLGPWYDGNGNDISNKLNTNYSTILLVDSSAVYWVSGGNGDTIPPTSIEAEDRSQYNYYRDTSKDIIYVSQFSDSITTYKIKDDDARNSIANKQDTLVSGTNIKTINGNSILGEGNLVISGGGGSSEWGQITGTLSDQTDLQDALDDKSKVSMVDWDEETTTDLSELVINTLSQEDYDELVENDQVNDNELYMVPDDSIVGATGTFISNDGKTVTVRNGIITSIV